MFALWDVKTKMEWTNNFLHCITILRDSWIWLLVITFVFDRIILRQTLIKTSTRAWSRLAVIMTMSSEILHNFTQFSLIYNIQRVIVFVHILNYWILSLLCTDHTNLVLDIFLDQYWHHINSEWLFVLKSDLNTSCSTGW